jgi:hypothetical protein
MSRIKPIALPIAGLLLAAFLQSDLRAEVLVEGEARDVRVEARDATVVDILVALGEHFALRYRGSPASGGVTAKFEGPLRRVVARVLDGYNFVIRENADGIEVIVLSTTSPYAVPAPPTAPPTVPSRRQRAD